MSLRFFLKRHQDWVLAAVSAVFLLIIAWLFLEGIAVAVSSLGRAFSYDQSKAPAIDFKIQEAQNILGAHSLIQR